MHSRRARQGGAGRLPVLGLGSRPDAAHVANRIGCCVAKSATCRATRHMLFASALASRLASSALLSRVAVASSPRSTLARFGFPAGRVSDRGAGLWVSAARGKRSKTDSGGMRGVKKENLPTKTCVVCDRPFTWRKKWERCWDEVTTCSKSCNAARRREKQSGASGADESDGASDDDGEASDVDVIPSSPRGEGADAKDAKRDVRKAAKRAAKAAKRAKRAGEDGGAGGSKPCDGCDKASDLLVRCQVDESKRWQMLCGACWKRKRKAREQWVAHIVQLFKKFGSTTYRHSIK